ncbi:hypothetical protein HK097_008048 [Rhizophlyctis rosea]|uniref:Uncharacterized protein n=1 Tax=Rhizophlyctis rosea TaxID=64517 RepID=A0AAD5SJ20_9FUNG|nr:hypothetical protein HK097_008048 [Rhizophlyctis rosea]
MSETNPTDKPEHQAQQPFFNLDSILGKHPTPTTAHLPNLFRSNLRKAKSPVRPGSKVTPHFNPLRIGGPLPEQQTPAAETKIANLLPEPRHAKKSSELSQSHEPVVQRLDILDDKQGADISETKSLRLAPMAPLQKAFTPLFTTKRLSRAPLLQTQLKKSPISAKQMPTTRPLPIPIQKDPPPEQPLDLVQGDHPTMAAPEESGQENRMTESEHYEAGLHSFSSCAADDPHMEEQHAPTSEQSEEMIPQSEKMTENDAGTIPDHPKLVSEGREYVSEQVVTSQAYREDPALVQAPVPAGKDRATVQAPVPSGILDPVNDDRRIMLIRGQARRFRQGACRGKLSSAPRPLASYAEHRPEPEEHRSAKRKADEQDPIAVPVPGLQGLRRPIGRDKTALSATGYGQQPGKTQHKTPAQVAFAPRTQEPTFRPNAHEYRTPVLDAETDWRALCRKIEQDCTKETAEALKSGYRAQVFMNGKRELGAPAPRNGGLDQIDHELKDLRARMLAGRAKILDLTGELLRNIEPATTLVQEQPEAQDAGNEQLVPDDDVAPSDQLSPIEETVSSDKPNPEKQEVSPEPVSCDVDQGVKDKGSDMGESKFDHGSSVPNGRQDGEDAGGSDSDESNANDDRSSTGADVGIQEMVED